MVVDDTNNIRTLLTKCLKMEGYDVKTANDGYEAVDAFSTETFDLAFLDIKMPYFSGTDVLKKIRSMGIATPVIIITAYATVKNAVECTRLGAVAYLQKPFTAEKVRSVLAELNEDSFTNAAYHKIAEKMLDEGDFAGAFNFLKNMLSKNPLDPMVYMLLSRASDGLGHSSESKKFLMIYESLCR